MIMINLIIAKLRASLRRSVVKSCKSLTVMDRVTAGGRAFPTARDWPGIGPGLDSQVKTLCARASSRKLA